MIRILRGTSSDPTNSSTENVPTRFLPAASATRSCVFSGERLNTDTLKPLLSMLRAKFLPITAKPITPICCFDIWFSTLCTLYFCEIHFSQYKNTTLCQRQQSSACEREINFIDKLRSIREIAHNDYFNGFVHRSEPRPQERLNKRTPRDGMPLTACIHFAPYHSSAASSLVNCSSLAVLAATASASHSRIASFSKSSCSSTASLRSRIRSSPSME